MHLQSQQPQARHCPVISISVIGRRRHMHTIRCRQSANHPTSPKCRTDRSVPLFLNTRPCVGSRWRWAKLLCSPFTNNPGNPVWQNLSILHSLFSVLFGCDRRPFVRSRPVFQHMTIKWPLFALARPCPFFCAPRYVAGMMGIYSTECGLTRANLKHMVPVVWQDVFGCKLLLLGCIIGFSLHPRKCTVYLARFSVIFASEQTVRWLGLYNNSSRCTLCRI